MDRPARRSATGSRRVSTPLPGTGTGRHRTVVVAACHHAEPVPADQRLAFFRRLAGRSAGLAATGVSAWPCSACRPGRTRRSSEACSVFWLARAASSWPPASQQRGWLAVPVLAGAASWLLVAARPRSAIELLALLLLGWLATPLVYFVLYFCLLHSPRHLLAECGRTPRGQRPALFKVALVFTVATLALAVPAVIWLVQSGNVEQVLGPDRVHRPGRIDRSTHGIDVLGSTYATGIMAPG